MPANERLDAALVQLEALNEEIHDALTAYEDADFSYEVDYRKARARTEGTVTDRDHQAETHCADLGLDTARRVAKVKVDAIKFKARNIQTIIDGLRSKIAWERKLTE